MAACAKDGNKVMNFVIICLNTWISIDIVKTIALSKHRFRSCQSESLKNDEWLGQKDSEIKTGQTLKLVW